jgi:hypothetical protein
MWQKTKCKQKKSPFLRNKQNKVLTLLQNTGEEKHYTNNNDLSFFSFSFFFKKKKTYLSRISYSCPFSLFFFFFSFRIDITFYSNETGLVAAFIIRSVFFLLFLKT